MTTKNIPQWISKDWIIKILLMVVVGVVAGAWTDLKDTRERLIVVETKLDILMARDDGRMLDYNILKSVPKVGP